MGKSVGVRFSEFSLSTFFCKKVMGMLFKCVSPPLVGVVLALCFGVTAHADDKSGTFSLHLYDGMSNLDSVQAFSFNDWVNWNSTDGYEGVKLVYSDLTVTMPYWYKHEELYDTNILHSSVRLRLYVNNTEYVIYPLFIGYSNSNDYQQFTFATADEPLELYADFFENNGNNQTQVRFVFEYTPSRVLNFIPISGTSSIGWAYVSCSYTFSRLGYYYRAGESGISSPDKSDAEISAIDRVTDSVSAGNQAAQDRWDEENSSATAQGDETNAFVTDAQDTIKSKWEILFYPITFSNDVLQVFTSGSDSSTYNLKYAGVTGYSYDDATGMLLPVRSPTARTVSSSSSLTFPSFTLPVLNVQLWDSYTFDLSLVKDDFSVLFDAIYVIISILELYWFVGFLTDKYHEVFG